METLGTRIRKLRIKQNLTQALVSKASGVSRSSVVQWEQDTNQPRGESLIALSKALDCDPDWLLHGKEKAGNATTDNAVNNQSEKHSVSRPSNDNLISLDFFDVEVSAGHGALVIKEDKSDCITFSKKFIDEMIGVNPKNVFLMPVRGDSMMPTLKNQAVIMVNKIEEFSGDGVYVFRFDGQLMVKRLQFSKTGLTVVSDNTSYKEWELTRDELATEDFKIIGEVVWSGQRI
jgi:phage repressor protein C with HTH and peptisase S24 domain